MRRRQTKAASKPFARVASVFDVDGEQVRVITTASTVADIERSIAAQMAYYGAHCIRARVTGVEIEEGAAPRGFSKFADDMAA